MKRGNSLIFLLLGLVVIGILYTQNPSLMPSVAPGAIPGVVSPAGIPEALGMAKEATCKANKANIQQAIQMYNMRNPPMKTLDVNALAAYAQMPSASPGGICQYSLDEGGNVICSTHK